MKKFSGIKSQEEMVSSLLLLGYIWLETSQRAYAAGSDYMLLNNSKEKLQLFVCIFNGSFRVKDIISGHEIATNKSSHLDDVEWYKNILDAIYKEKK